jgi:hypothetical protein
MQRGGFRWGSDDNSRSWKQFWMRLELFVLEGKDFTCVHLGWFMLELLCYRAKDGKEQGIFVESDEESLFGLAHFYALMSKEAVRRERNKGV